MTATSMPARVLELCRRAFRWSAPGAIFALAPKCALCVAAYFGFGGALGRTGVEICAAPDGAMPVNSWLLLGSLALGLGAAFAWNRGCGKTAAAIDSVSEKKRRA